jgi:hypothetical protein
MTLTIELPDNLESALKAHANAQGVSEAGYIRTLLERDLSPSTPTPSLPPFETGFGSLAKYGPAPTAEEIDANRTELLERSQRAGERIRELRKGNFLHGVSIKELIDEGRE